MTTLFIFKSNARGMQYGLGTYINELIESLLANSDFILYLIIYHNRDYNEFTIKPLSERYSEVCIPSTKFSAAQNTSFNEKYASSVVRLLSELIPLEGSVVFQLNYIDDLSIAIKLKEHYNYPVISVVQFAQWQQFYNGNRQKMIGLNIDEPSDNYEFTFHQERKMYRISDHIVSVTRYMKDFLASEYEIDPEIISIIPNGLDYRKYTRASKPEKDNLRRLFGFSRDDILILFSGRIDACKGVFYLLEAFEDACIHNNKLRLIVMGQGDLEGCYKKLTSSFGKVTFTGFLAKDIVTLFYKIADIGIVPSVYDHCPLTILEMMANKIPLIVSKINGPDEMLDPGQCIFIEPDIDKSGDITFNKKDLSDIILTLAGDQSLRKKLSNNSYKKLREVFSSTRMAEDMKNLFSTFPNNNTIIYEKDQRR